MDFWGRRGARGNVAGVSRVARVSWSAKESAPRVAAGALFVDECNRVLMLRPTYKPYWDIPGGYVDATETPFDACTREIYEEIGLRVDVGALLVVDWAPHPDEGDKVLFVFDGGRLDDDQLAGIRFTDGEIDEWDLVDEKRLDEVTVPRLSRRIRQALRARDHERPRYLHHGD